jgi:hypothetical protein
MYFLSFSRRLILRLQGLEEAKNLAGKSPPTDSDLFCRFLRKIPPACQANAPRLRIADSSCIKAVSFSSARTTKRFPSRCASTIQIVRPWNQSLRQSPNSNRPVLRLSAMISQYFFTAAKPLDIDLKTGRVSRITPIKSAGSAILDRVSTAAFSRWVFIPGKWSAMIIPTAVRITWVIA